MNKKDYIIIVTIVIVGLLLPFVLNLIIQLPAFVPIIGNEETWLSFWGSYSAAVLSATTLYAAFATLRVTINIQRQSNKLALHNELRKTITELNKYIDFILLGQINQDVFNGDVTKAKDLLIEQTRAFNNASRNLTLLMQDLDILHENKKEQIRRINEAIIPYRDVVWNICQYAIMKEGIQQHAYGNMPLEEIVSSIDPPLSDIMKPYVNLGFEEFNKAVCTKLLQSVNAINSKAISDAFNAVYGDDAKKAYNYALLNISMPKQVLQEEK